MFFSVRERDASVLLLADFLCLQHQKESLPDIRRGFCAIGFIGFRPGDSQRLWRPKSMAVFFLMKGQGVLQAGR